MFTQVCPFGNASWFTFAWPLGENALKPRGASTRGAPVLPDPAPGEAWRRLREPGLSALERDRRAILVMRVQMADGSNSKPIVMRHWRQEWRYRSDALLAYEGANTWARRPVPAQQREGAWVQSVYQVDDSPRYAARGRWQHNDSYSIWISDETWRPRPWCG